MEVYRIVKWEKTFETADSRRHKTLAWVSLPVGFGSNGYHELIATFGDEAPAIYGAWCALLSVAALAPVRGVLASSKGPFSFARISADTRMPEVVFRKLFEWASQPEVGWLEKVSNDSEPATDQPSTGCQSIYPTDHTQQTKQTQQNNTHKGSSKQGSNSAPGLKTNPIADGSVGDGMGIKSFLISELVPTASEIFRRTGYTGDQGKNLWKFAALRQAGIITEHELWDSCEETRAKGDDAPAYLFGCLRNRLRERERPADLSDLVKLVRVRPKCPPSAPLEV